MLKYVCLLVVLASVCQCSLRKKSDNRNNLFRFFAHHVLGVNQSVGKKLQVNGFDWKNCGSSGDLATIKSLNVSPDPIHVPGNVTVSFSGSLSQQMAAPVQLSLKIKKKELFWIPIPCMDNLGSCDYDDICAMISGFQCPPAFIKHGISCHCPIKKGDYSLPESVIDVSSFGIPSWLENGDFQVTATMKYKGRQVICVHVDFTLG